MPCIDRQRGTLLGLAIGDALGAAVEFKSPGTFPEVTGYRGGGPHGLAPGEWTDDTSMALALADSIASVGWDLNDQARRYVAWWRKGEYSVNGRCFDIGITTRSALRPFREDRRCQDLGRPLGAGQRQRLDHAAGPGADPLRRPVPRPNWTSWSGYCVESSLPTHASPQCLSACAYLGLVLCGLIHGIDREEVLAPDWEPLQQLKQIHPLHPEVAEVAAGSFRQKQPPEIVGSRLRGQEPGGGPVGLPRRQGLPRGRAAGREPGRRRRHDRGRLRAACRGVLGRVGDSAGVAGGLARPEMIEKALQGLLGGQGMSKFTPKLASADCRAADLVELLGRARASAGRGLSW